MDLISTRNIRCVCSKDTSTTTKTWVAYGNSHLVCVLIHGTQTPPEVHPFRATAKFKNRSRNQVKICYVSKLLVWCCFVVVCLFVVVVLGEILFVCCCCCFLCFVLFCFCCVSWGRRGGERGGGEEGSISISIPVNRIRDVSSASPLNNE